MSIPRALRAWSAEPGPASTAVPSASSWQCSHTSSGSLPRRAAAARLTSPGSGGQPDAAASVPPAGSSSASSTRRLDGHVAANAKARVVTPHERTAPSATTLI